MADASVPVDLFNPGQVFACLGLMEAAEVLCGETQATFDWSDPANVRFHLRAAGNEHPVLRVLAFLAEAEVQAEAPYGSNHVAAWTASWGTPPRVLSKDEPYPFPNPTSPATLRAALRAGEKTLVIDHWGDTTRDNVKFWAGAGGFPGAGLTRDALALVQKYALSAVEDPFNLALPQSSSFRLDWRRDYIPIDAGFSLNAHSGKIEAVGYPLVELLGALGLTHARPRRPVPRDKLVYAYGVVGADTKDNTTFYPPSLVRAALGGATLPFPTKRFRMQLGWPGKEGQARAITHVTEEN